MSIDLENPATLSTAIAAGIGVLGGGYMLLKNALGGKKVVDDLPAITLPVKQYRRILVPTGLGMSHDDYVQEAASLACHLAQKKGKHATEIIFSYVIPVPRALPLNASLPEEEQEAERILAEAATLAKARGVQKVITQLRKGRTLVDETLKAVDQETVDLVILTPQSHAAAEAAVPLARQREATTVPCTQAAAIQAVHAGNGPGRAAEKTCTLSRCYAELDNEHTSDVSETVTGKLLRRLPCEAMVARSANPVPAVNLAPAFSMN